MATSSASQGVTLSYVEPPHFRRIVKQVLTFDDLLSLLMALPKSESGDLAIGVDVNDQEGNGLSIGIAHEGWLLIFGDAKHTHMAFSVGDQNATGDVVFRFHQQEQLPRRYLLSVDDAIQAIRCWFETGKLSDAVKWDVQPY